MVGGITMVGAIISNKAPVDLTAVTPIARLTGDPLVVVVPASSDVQTLDDLLAAIQADVGGTIWAGGSAGGADHMLAALITGAAGADPSQLNYVAYSGGGEALAAMLGDQVTAGDLGLRRVAGADRVRRPSCAGDLVPRPDRGDRGAAAEGAGRRRRAGQLARRLRRPRHLRRGQGAARRGVRGDGRLGRVAGAARARGWTDYYLPADEFAAFLTEETERVGEDPEVGRARRVGLADGA